jgi:acid stress-induced BolA-like protein IbaG/YrbA
MEPQKIADMILAGLPGSQVDVHSEDNTHYEARVVAEQFDGQRSLARHQLVYGCLGQAMGGEIHALSLQTFSPAEWAQQLDQ